jgi:hypothetical protein
MSALVLSAMVLCADPIHPPYDPDQSERIRVLSILVDLSSSIFHSTVIEVVRGSQPSSKLFKRGIDVAVAGESRIECWLFGSTELLKRTKAFLKDR